MKKLVLFTIIALLYCFTTLSAQAPQGFNYQCIVRDASNAPITNQTVTLIFSLRNGDPTGAVVYAENHTISTNDFGLVNLVIGQGTPSSGTFSSVDWSAGSKYLKVFVLNGVVATELGTSQLMSVPYALYAGNGGGSVGPAGPVGPTGPAGAAGATGSAGAPGAAGPIGATGPAGPPGSGDNWGTQFVQRNATLAGNGTVASPLALAQQGAVAGQVIKWNGSAWVPQDDATGGGGTNNNYTGGTGINISGAAPNFVINNTGDTDNSATNEIQALSISGTTLSLSTGGGSVTLPAGPQGPIGLTGAAGTPGAQGSIGLTGAAGAQGPIGLTGAPGAQGPIGLTGTAGTPGAQGPIGLTGAAGTPGAQGPIGLTGAMGAQGLQGVEGPVGPAGAGFTLPYAGDFPLPIGVVFNINNTDGVGAAIRGAATGGAGIAGYSDSGQGVHATSVTGTGVYGSSQDGTAGHFESNNGPGVYGESEYSTGVQGVSLSGGTGGFFSSASGVALATGEGKVGIGVSNPEDGVRMTVSQPRSANPFLYNRILKLQDSNPITGVSGTAIEFSGIGTTGLWNINTGISDVDPGSSGFTIVHFDGNTYKSPLRAYGSGTVSVSGPFPQTLNTLLEVGTSINDGVHTNAIHGQINSSGTAIYGQNIGAGGVGVFGSVNAGTAGLFIANDPAGVALNTSGGMIHQLDGIDGNAGGDQIHYDFGNGVNDLIIRARNAVDPELVPSVFETGSIGTENLPFNNVWSKAFFASVAGGYLNYSDARLKENIAPLTSSLEKIMQLQPKLYDIKRERYYAGRKDKPESGRLNEQGFLAQDVAKVFPKLVQEDENGTLAMSYVGLIPATIGSIQEQQAQIVKLTKENKALRAELEKQQALNIAIEARLQRMEAALAIPITSGK